MFEKYIYHDFMEGFLEDCLEELLKKFLVVCSNAFLKKFTMEYQRNFPIDPYRNFDKMNGEVSD